MVDYGAYSGMQMKTTIVFGAISTFLQFNTFENELPDGWKRGRRGSWTFILEARVMFAGHCGRLWQWPVESTMFIVILICTDPFPAALCLTLRRMISSGHWTRSTHLQRQLTWCGSRARCKNCNRIFLLDMSFWLDDWMAGLRAD